MLRSTAGATALALLAGGLVTVGLVAAAPSAQAATIPTNPCVVPETPPVTTAPVVTRVSTPTRVVDVRRHAKTLAVTVTAHDTVAITRVVVTVSEFRPVGKSTWFTAVATLVSGSTTDGVWRASVLLPRFIPAGTYRVNKVLVRDVGRGVSAYYRNKLPDAWPSRFQVRSITDRTAPVVTGFRVSARAVDTRTAPTTITLRARVRDDLSGVAKVRVSAGGTDPVRGDYQPEGRGISVYLAPSPGHPHRWVGRAVVPMWVGISTWRFSMKVTDRLGHRRRIHPDTLARRGWQSTMRVTSGRDVVQPSLAALTFAPGTVDARSGDVRVDVSFRVTDDRSGASPLTQLEVGPIAVVVVSSVTGATTDRTFHGYLTVPRCGLAAESSWQVNAVIVDNALNQRWLPKDRLDELGLPSELPVRQRDSMAPILLRWGPIAAGAPWTLQFSDPVLMVAPPASLLRVRVDGAVRGGTWMCRNGAGDEVVCDADDAAVLTATFTPDTAFVTGDQLAVERVRVWPERTGIYDLDGVPLTDATAGITVT
jgi:hypothetical protein